MRLSSKHTFSPSADEMGVIANFMAVQHLRTPRGRRMAVDAGQLAATMSFFNFLGKNDPDLARQVKNPFEELKFEMQKEWWPYAHAATLLDIDTIEELAGILLQHIWLVTENNSNRTYYTSDHPLALIPHVKHPFRTMAGIRSKGIQILYPLSPTHSLNLLEQTFWKKFERYHRQVLTQPPVKDNIDFDNSTQVIHSSRFIYSRDGDFKLAEEMCQECPEMRNPDHPEIATRLGTEMLPQR
jgi:hypothetical protein